MASGWLCSSTSQAKPQTVSHGEPRHPLFLEGHQGAQPQQQAWRTWQQCNVTSYLCPQWHFRGNWGSKDTFQWNSRAVHMFKGHLSKSSWQEEESLLWLELLALQRYWPVKLYHCAPSNVQSYSRPFTLSPVLKRSSQLEVHFTSWQQKVQLPWNLFSLFRSIQHRHWPRLGMQLCTHEWSWPTSRTSSWLLGAVNSIYY